MSDFENIVEFLRLYRRSEEAEKKALPPTEVFFTSLEDNKSYYVNKNNFETDFVKYKRIIGILEYYDAESIFLLKTSTERKYFVKTTYGKYCNLLDESIVMLNEEWLIEFPVEFATHSYIYDTEKNMIVTLATTLKEVFIFPDIIYYDPKGKYMMDIESDIYTYDYEDDVTTFGKIMKVLFEDESYLWNNPEKKVQVMKSEKAGKINLIPFMQVEYGLGNFILKYRYYEKGYRPKFFLPDDECALILKFKGIGGLLTFFNQTLFKEGFSLEKGDRENVLRDYFRDQFMDQIIHTLEDNLKNKGTFSYQDAMKTLFYLPQSVAAMFSDDFLWMLLEMAIKRDSLTNKTDLAEENIFVKLIRVILQKEGKEIKLMNWFLETIKDGDENITKFEFIYDRINGDNFIEFVKLINQAWKKSRFIYPDTEQNPEFATTDGLLFLPYSSEKTLGFYFSNVKMSFETHHQKGRLIKTLYETGKYKTEMRPSLKTDNLVPTQVQIIDQFWYHPFYPIYLKDIENQETDMKLDSIVPAFMLKANRDKQFWSNVITTAEYAADILTTLSGVGNITKFRYLARVAQLAEVVEGASAVTKVARAVNILRYVKGAAGVVELTSGSVNLMLKITGARDTEFGESLSKVLFFLELITLSGELTASMKLGLRKSAKEAVEASNGALRVKHPELFAELYKIAGLKKVYQHIDDFMKTRPKFHDINLVNQLWKEKIINKLLFPINLRKLYFKYLEEFPGLQKGFNQAEFKTTILNKGQKVEEVVEFSLSGKKEKLLSTFGDPPSLPENTIDILSDYDNFEAFVKGASDFEGKPRNYDSEIKYIFNFLKNHIDKGDEFIIETQNIFKTCGSCRREFVMLEDYLKLQGKKVKIVVMSDEIIKGTEDLKIALKLKKKK